MISLGTAKARTALENLWSLSCLVRFDNESGKGDHIHIGSKEKKYLFIDVETLVADFLAEIEKARRK
jgi:hypothetical protein